MSARYTASIAPGDVLGKPGDRTRPSASIRFDMAKISATRAGGSAPIGMFVRSPDSEFMFFLSVGGSRFLLLYIVHHCSLFFHLHKGYAASGVFEMISTGMPSATSCSKPRIPLSESCREASRSSTPSVLPFASTSTISRSCTLTVPLILPVRRRMYMASAILS